MHILFETPAGYALFKLMDESVLDLPDVSASFQSAQDAQSL